MPPKPGWDGMPEVVATARLRQLGASEPQVRLFLTFNAAMDRARDADVLARRAALERSHSIAVVVIIRLSDRIGRCQAHGEQPMAASEGRVTRLADPVPPRRAAQVLASATCIDGGALCGSQCFGPQPNREMRGTWTGGKFISEATRALSGRPKTELLTADGQRTRRHRLNMVPEMVGYGDARKTVAILIRVLDALAQSGCAECRVSRR